jgi:imidazolonepropionase-like amidohydrolase
VQAGGNYEVNGDFIDRRDSTILPGMIDMHAPLTGSSQGHGDKRLASSQTGAAL